MTRTRAAALATTLAIGLALAGAARTQAVPPGEQAAFLFAYDIDRGRRAEFEAGYKAHLAWHADHQDVLPWFGWYVTSGPRTGLFIDGTFGVEFSAMDRRPDPAGDGQDMAARVLPFVQPRFSAAYRLWPEVSTASTLEARQPSRTLDAYTVRVAPRDVAAFEAALSSLAAPVRATPDRLGWTWYRLATGGGVGSYLVLVARGDWSGLADRPRDMTGLIAAAYGAKPATARAAADLIEAAEVETWSYQPSLSRLP